MSLWVLDQAKKYAASVGLPTGGTAGQILSKVDGTNYNAEWSALTGEGRILQIKSSTLATAAVTTSGSYVTTGLSVAITPTSTDSTLLIFVSGRQAATRVAGTILQRWGAVRLYQKETSEDDVQLFTQIVGRNLVAASGESAPSYGLFTTVVKVDPTSTNELTFEVYHLSSSATNVQVTTYELSSVTVLEIGG